MLLGTALCALFLGACGGDDERPESPVPTFAIYDWEANLIGGGEPYAERSDAEAVAEDSPETIIVESASQYFVVSDEPAVTIDDVASARPGFSAATSEPSVLVELTADGEREFVALTETVARRTAEEREAQHIALVAEGAVVSLPMIDVERNPAGLSARQGLSIEGGFTIEETEELAAAINEG